MKFMISLLTLLGIASSKIFDLDSSPVVYIEPSGTAFFKINSNPISGYYWEIEPPNTNEIVIDSLRGTFTPPKLDNIMSGGEQLFKITCYANCDDGSSFKLKIKHQKIWESQATDYKDFLVIVTNDQSLLN